FACLIGNDRAPTLHDLPMLALLLCVAAGRLLVNLLFGLQHIQWRYIGLHEAFRTGKAYLAFSAIFLLTQLSLPERAAAFRVRWPVVVIEGLLSLLGALGIRGLRRSLYEIHL